MIKTTNVTTTVESIPDLVKEWTTTTYTIEDPTGIGVTTYHGDVLPYTTKEFNCPDCERTDSCEGCPRVLVRETKSNKQVHVPEYFPDSIIWPKGQYIPRCCRNCSNHPSNGGSGICNCTLPYFEQQTTGGPNITW